MIYETRNKRSVWKVTCKPYKGAHFAVYPPELIIDCIKAGSEEGDCVLDPFMGSGTTAMVAKSLGRDYIGCELHEDYGNLIKQRVEEYEPVKEVAQEPTVNILDLI
jgi:DNA modification methylase